MILEIRLLSVTFSSNLFQRAFLESLPLKWNSLKNKNSLKLKLKSMEKVIKIFMKKNKFEKYEENVASTALDEGLDWNEYISPKWFR